MTASEDHVNLGEATVTLNVLGMMGNPIKSLESFCHLKSNNIRLTMNVALLTSWLNVVYMLGAANHPTRHLIGYINTTPPEFKMSHQKLFDAYQKEWIR